MTTCLCGCAGSPWRVAVQNASKVGVAGSGVRQVLVGRTANVDVIGCKTPATVTVVCEMRLFVCLLALFYLRYYLHLGGTNAVICLSGYTFELTTSIRSARRAQISSETFYFRI